LNGGESPDVKLDREEFTGRLVDTYSIAKAHGLFKAMLERGTWLTPTFGAIQGAWSTRRRELNVGDAAANDRAAEHTVRMFADAKRAGVKILAGSDLPLRDGVPAIHDELAALVRAGLSPMQALQAATREPADFFGRLGTAGTIERGKTADLVLLDANPLVDIRNTRQVAAVIRRGRAHKRAELIPGAQ